MLIDLDHGGTIDAEELQELTRSLGSRIPIEQAQDLIDQFDVSKTGTLNFPDFLTLMFKIKSGVLELSDNVLVTALMESRNQIAILEEIEDVKHNPPENVFVYHYGGTPVVCDFILIGFAETPYENGQFKLRVVFQAGYPYQKPQIHFQTRIFSANILTQTNGTGHLMHLSSIWDSRWNMRKLIGHVFQLMTEPDLTLIPAVMMHLVNAWIAQYDSDAADTGAEAEIETLSDGPQLATNSKKGSDGDGDVGRGSVVGNFGHDSIDLAKESEPSLSFSEKLKLKAKISVGEQVDALSRIEQMHLNVLSLFVCDRERYNTSIRQCVAVYASEKFISDAAIQEARLCWDASNAAELSETAAAYFQRQEVEQGGEDGLGLGLEQGGEDGLGLEQGGEDGLGLGLEQGGEDGFVYEWGGSEIDGGLEREYTDTEAVAQSMGC
jgi:ubiquitin-protein ligase